MARFYRKTGKDGILSKREPYYVLVHFYEGKADALQYVNWVNSPKAFSENEIADLLEA